MSELHDSVDYNNLKFEFVGPNKNVSFFEYMDSKELFNAIKNGQIKITLDKNKKQDEFLNNLSNIKILKETPNKKGWLIILLDFTILENKNIDFFRD